jgi:hypothetical protein
MRRLKAGCATFRREAAREKLPVSTNAKKSSSHAIRIVEIFSRAACVSIRGRTIRLKLNNCNIFYA